MQGQGQGMQENPPRRHLGCIVKRADSASQAGQGVRGQGASLRGGTRWRGAEPVQGTV